MMMMRSGAWCEYEYDDGDDYYAIAMWMQMWPLVLRLCMFCGSVGRR